MTNFGRKKLIINLILTFIIILPFVLGATNLLEQIFSPFKGINVGQTYLRYAAFIDAILYFWLFIAIAKGVFKDKFPTSVATVMGLILAIGMCVFEYQAKFNLGMLSWIPFLIICFLIGYFFYKGAKEIGASTPMAIFLGLILPLIVINMSPSLMNVLNKLSWWPAVYGWLLIIVIIFGIYAVINLVKGIKSGDLNFKHAQKGETDTMKSWGGLINKEEKAKQNLFNLDQETSNLDTKLKELEQIEMNLETQDLNSRKNQLVLLQQLEQALEGTTKLQTYLQSIYSNIGNPAYADKIPEIQNYANMLNQYINTLRTRIAQLNEAISKNYEMNEKKIVEDQKLFQMDITKILVDLKKTHKITENDFKAMTRVCPSAASKLKKEIEDEDKEVVAAMQAQDKLYGLSQTMKVNFEDMERLDKQDMDLLKKTYALTLDANFENKSMKNFTLKLFKKKSLDMIRSNIVKVKNNTDHILNYLEPGNEKMIAQRNDLLKQEHQFITDYKNKLPIIIAKKQQYLSDGLIEMEQLMVNYEKQLIGNLDETIKTATQDMLPGIINQLSANAAKVNAEIMSDTRLSISVKDMLKELEKYLMKEASNTNNKKPETIKKDIIQRITKVKKLMADEINKYQDVKAKIKK